MSWHQFRYIFTSEIENAMRYSIHEAMRRQCYGDEANAVANDAVESFKRKMDKHAPEAWLKRNNS